MLVSLLVGGVVAMVTSVCAPADDPAPAVDRALVERAAVAAEQALPKARRIRMEVASEWHRAPDGAEHIDPKIPPYSVDSQLLAMWGDRDRCDRLVMLTVARAYTRVFADGLLYQASIAENDGTVNEQPISDVTNIGLGILMQIDVPTMAGGATSVAGVIRRGTVLATEATGARIAIRLVPPGMQEQLDKVADERKIPRMKAWVYGVTVDTADPPRLVEVWTELPASQQTLPDGTKRDMPARIDRWAVTEWQTVGEETVAGALRRTTSDPREGREIVQMVKLIEAEAIPPDVPPPAVLPQGIHVEDARRNFHFTVGSREVVFGGRTLTLKEPLYQHPGAKLDELISTAEAR